MYSGHISTLDEEYKHKNCKMFLLTRIRKWPGDLFFTSKCGRNTNHVSNIANNCRMLNIWQVVT